MSRIHDAFSSIKMIGSIQELSFRNDVFFYNGVELGRTTDIDHGSLMLELGELEGMLI